MATAVSPVIPGFQHLELKVAESQEQYRTLPSLPIDDDLGTLLTRWELTDEEVIYIVEHRCLYIWLSTFNNPVQPLMVTAEDVKIGERTEGPAFDKARGRFKSNGGIG